MNSFSDALTIELNRRRDANAMNDALVASLPQDPERGSYYWWARICRENTGQNMLDSGIAYGYAYNAGVPDEDTDPITVEFHDGELDTISVNTIKWLEAVTDATDETALAIEKVLYWCGNWLHPKDSWESCITKFGSDLSALKQAIFEYGARGEIRVRVNGQHSSVRKVLDAAMSSFRYYDFPRAYRIGAWPNERISEEGFRKDALADFPRKELVALWEADIFDLSIGRGNLTYNHENDLSQDFQYELIGSDKDIYDEQFAIIQVHTGCDIRGGYTAPVVVAIDPDSFFTWQADLYCTECDTCFDDMYSYSRKWEEKDKPLIQHKELLEKQALLEAIDAGQLCLPNVDTLAPLTDVEKVTIKYIEQLVEEDATESVYPQGIIVDEHNEPVKFPDSDGFPASRVRLLCPECGKYGVCVGIMVEGM